MLGDLDQRFGEANGKGAGLSVPFAKIVAQNGFEALALDQIRE
jgi:hypothetical protein